MGVHYALNSLFYQTGKTWPDHDFFSVETDCVSMKGIAYCLKMPSSTYFTILIQSVAMTMLPKKTYGQSSNLILYAPYRRHVSVAMTMFPTETYG